MIRFVLRNLVCCIAAGVFLLPVVIFAGEADDVPNDVDLDTTVTPTAFLESAEMISTGKRIQAFRVPTKDSDGKVKYYDVTIPLTVNTDGKIAATAPVKSVISPTVLSNQFVSGTYTYHQSICKVGVSILKGGRMEMDLACDTNGYPLSASIVTGPIKGHPFQLDLQNAKIGEIPGYQSYAWGKVGTSYHDDMWSCFSTADIISARQSGDIIALSCYDKSNIQKCGISLILKR